VYVLPPTTVTWIVQASADAEGSAAVAKTTRRLAVSAITYSSFRLLLNVSYSSEGSRLGATFCIPRAALLFRHRAR